MDSMKWGLDLMLRKWSKIPSSDYSCCCVFFWERLGSDENMVAL